MDMNKNKYTHLMNLVCLLAVISMAFVPGNTTAPIAVTAGSGLGPTTPETTVPALPQFIDQIKNGSSTQITGLYVEDLFSYPVVQQPGGQPAYVSPNDDQVTQFRMASTYGTLGFLAHNTLAGAIFSEVMVGSVITVIFGDGQYIQYQVNQIRKFQAIQPNNPYTSFVDLANNQTLSVEDVFYQTYSISDQLILQTCISSQGIDSWGRLFVIATPYVPVVSVLDHPMSLTHWE
jgi:hypothetical protein